ncbi:hypothetical protein A3K86_22145 [Photobacterium jeanii]|uniref:OmpR/PhoB-type domain-containing protein n=1 Tax=Photobacterium jeanii TaxID=858640 RepID=A0A178K2T4_9GAMM|nr:helix-turn-helix domain-containing protein [Photobacterium jeanii]OAN11619.1 hypothetical protein A3K86_22145 [Photobacterium jeanii]PST91140.1 helix-turn-helix domain-containing protein [Photobacterium jeanii]
MSKTVQIKFQTEVCFIPDEGIISSNNTSQTLNKAECNILLFLVENHQHAVTKEALIAAGWPDRDVTEASLFQVIRALRVKLQESYKGEIIETLPRVGYQLRHFQIEEIKPKFNSLVATKKTLLSKKAGTYIAAALIGTGMSYAAYLALTNQPDGLQNYTLHHMEVDGDIVTIAGSSAEIINELSLKVRNLNKSYNEVHSPEDKVNRRIYVSQHHDQYSVAWCLIDDTQTCVKDTDLAYSLPLTSWDKFADYIISIPEQHRLLHRIRTDYTLEPDGISQMHFFDDSNIRSKVVQYYLSERNEYDVVYSSMTFIKEEGKPLQQALSVKAATYRSLKGLNKDKSITSIKIFPQMFHWAYRSTLDWSENNSLALSNELKIRDTFNKGKGIPNHVIYHRDHLSLVFSEVSGYYWLHNRRSNSILFEATVNKEDTNAN